MTRIPDIPERVTNCAVLRILHGENINWIYIRYLKELTNSRTELISDCLHINVKTFRSYQKVDSKIREDLKEKIIFLISLFKHGQKVFGGMDYFGVWLRTDNFFLEKRKPISFLKTVSGIRLVQNRLTAMQFGDNI